MSLRQDIKEIDEFLGKGFRLLAVVLFSHKDAALIKCLDDSTYWNALSEISGDKIAVVVPRLIRRGGMMEAKPGLPDDTLGMMVAIDKPPEAGSKLLDWLGISGERELPQLVFFVIGPEENEVHVASVKIGADDKDKTFKALEAPLRTAADTIAAYHYEPTKERSILALEALQSHFKFRKAIRTVGYLTRLVDKLRGATGA